MEVPSEAELPIEDSEINSYGGGIFTGAHHFTVVGGTFKNTTNNYVSAPEVPPDFRMIPLGDIDLQRQIRVDEIRLDQNSGVISREQHGCVRRVYSAKVQGRKSDVTVAVYEGETAEEEWRRDFAKYMTVRHPYILQVCGTASSGGIHATLFHGDLIPYNQFLDLYQHSPILTAYIRGYTSTQFLDVWTYISMKDMRPPYTIWIRRSSGLLCLEISLPQSGDSRSWSRPDEILPELLPNLSIADQEDIVVHNLSLQQYYACCVNLSLFRRESISTSATVTLGAVVLWPRENRFETSHDLVCIRDVEIINRGWHTFPMSTDVFHTPDGSARFKAADVLGESLKLWFYAQSQSRSMDQRVWLSQANHIFHCLQVTDNYADYVMIDAVNFEVRIPPSAVTPPTGYLFLCPPSAFQAGSSSFGRWPDSPAYWSLDPLGIEHLSTEEAMALGFPSLLFDTRVYGYSWDASVYAGLRQFHAAKGFDPDSQDVARHLGYPLYELSCGMDVPFAHVVDEDPLTEVSSNDEDGVYEDPLAEVSSGVEDVPLSEAMAESPDSSNFLEPPMSRTFEVITGIQAVLMLFLVVCQVYETLRQLYD